MENEEIVLDIKFDAGKVATELRSVITSIADLKKEQASLKKEIEDGADATGELSAAYAQNEATIKTLTAKQKALSGQLNTTNTSADQLGDSFRELDARARDLENQYKSLTKAQRESVEGQQLKEQVIEAKQALKDFDAELGNHQRNVGNYPKTVTALIPGFDKLQGMLGNLGISFEDLGTNAKSALTGIGQGMAGLGKQAMAMLANPIIAAIAAVLVALKMLYDAFQRNEEAQLNMQKGLAPFKAMWQNFQRLFDDIVKLINKVTGAFGGFGKMMELYMRMYLLPFNVAIGVLRFAFLQLKQTFLIWTNIFKAAFGAVKNLLAQTPLPAYLEKVKSVLDNVKKAFVDFGKKVRETMDNIKNSKFGKFLGLDEYTEGLKDVIMSNQELIESNKRIAETEAAVQKQRTAAIQADADAQKEIAELRAKIAEKDKYTAKERLAMLEQANEKEEEIAKRALELAKAQYEAEKLKNSLTESNAEDLEREAQAYAAMVAAETALAQKQKELNSQMAAERKAIADEAAKRAEERRKKAEEEARILEEQAKALQAQEDKMRRRTQTNLQNQIEDLRNAMAEELAVIGLSEEQKQQIRDYYAGEEKRLKDEQAAEDAQREAERLAAIQAAREEFGIVAGKTPEEQELENLQAAREQDLLNDEEYEQAKTMILQKYADERAQKEKQELERAKKAMEERTRATMASFSALGNSLSQIGELLGEYADQNEDAAKAQKAFALSGILLNQAQSISEGALAIAKGVESASGLPFPANIPAIISIVAQIAGLLAGVGSSIQQAKQIFSQANSQKFATGGIVGGNSYTGDKINARLNSREMVLNTQQQTRLFDALNGQSDGSIGINYEMMAAAIAAQPAPVMVLKELRDEQDKVATFNEIASI